MSRPVVIDTDPGIDDALAIVYALNCPALELVGVTTVHGNIAVERSTRNALGVLELARPDLPVPVAAGAEAPLNGLPRSTAEHVHGTEGLGDTPILEPRRPADPRPAWRYLCDVTAARPGELTLCAIGPMTNLALALAADPGIAQRVAGVVVMGGAVMVAGNITVAAEYNVWADPAAAAAVFAASWPLTLVGLDVTTRMMCTAEDFAVMAAASPRVGGFLARAARSYVEFYRRAVGIPGCHLHDPSALIALSHPALFSGQHMGVEVDLHGAVRGRTRPVAAASGGGRALVLTGVDAAAVKAQFMLTLCAADRAACHP